MDQNKCVVCRNHIKTPLVDGRTWQKIDCVQCGIFSATADVVTRLSEMPLNEKEKAIVSHLIVRQQVNTEHKALLDLNLLRDFKTIDLPSYDEQLNNLILWFGDGRVPGEYVDTNMYKIQAISGALNFGNTDFVIMALVESSLIESSVQRSEGGKGRIRLTRHGWKHYSELKKGHVSERTAFMAMKFGEKYLDLMVEKCFKQAVDKAGFKLIHLLDEGVRRGGLIDDLVRVEIRKCAFLIADLSHENNGAYWSGWRSSTFNNFTSATGGLVLPFS